MGSWLNGLEGLCRPVSADMRSACARFRDRAGSGTRPWVACADCGERRIHQDKPEADRGSRRDRFRSAIAADSQWRGPRRQHRLHAFAQIDSQGLRARHMLKSGLLQPAKLLRPSVFTVEPSTTFSFRKPRSVAFLKSGMTAIREVLQLCSDPVIGWPDASPGLFGLRLIQVAPI
jgi:hypothetical protein